MNLRRFDLNLLLALDALLRERHVTRAAARVCVSQPAMSSCLAKLRAFFSDPLLVRVGTELRLTPRGLALQEPLRDALVSVRRTLAMQPHFDPRTEQRTVRLMAPDFAVPQVVPALLARLAAEAPGMRLQVHNGTSSGPARLLDGGLDFLMALENPSLQMAKDMPDVLSTLRLQRIRWVCAVWDQHPEVGEELTREQFMQLPHVYVYSSDNAVPVGEGVRRQLGMKLNVRATIDSVLQVPFVLPGTHLIAILPECLSALLRASLSIRVLPLPAGVSLIGRMNLYWHKRDDENPAHVWVREHIRELVGDANDGV